MFPKTVCHSSEDFINLLEIVSAFSAEASKRSFSMVQRPTKPQEEAIDENTKFGLNIKQKSELHERSRRSAEKVSGPEDTKVGQKTESPNKDFTGYTVKQGDKITVKEKNIEPVGPAARKI